MTNNSTQQKVRSLINTSVFCVCSLFIGLKLTGIKKHTHTHNTCRIPSSNFYIKHVKNVQSIQMEAF